MFCGAVLKFSVCTRCTGVCLGFFNLFEVNHFSINRFSCSRASVRCMCVCACVYPLYITVSALKLAKERKTENEEKKKNEKWQNNGNSLDFFGFHPFNFGLKSYYAIGVISTSYTHKCIQGLYVYFERSLIGYEAILCRNI